MSLNLSLHQRAATEAQKDRGAPHGARLFLVPGLRPVGRAVAPVAWPAGKPFEGGMTSEAFQDPAEVTAVVGRDAQFGVVGRDRRQRVEHLAREEAALVVAPFRPGIRKQDEHAIDRSRRQRRDQQPRVIGKNAYIVEPALLDFREKLDDPVLENLAADETDLVIPFGLLRQMLAAAEAD